MLVLAGAIMPREEDTMIYNNANARFDGSRRSDGVHFDKGCMTPSELKTARKALGLSAERFARLVRVQSWRTVRRWEAGERDIPGPIVVIVELLANPAARKALLP